tara:strand:- start:27 stop:182 length:156 start_codon:yes stop_codon:yes gene_type:complete
MEQKLKNLKGSKGLIKVGGDMEKTLKRLGITPADLLRIKAQKKTKKKKKTA